MRNNTPLNNGWRFVKTAASAGEASIAASIPVTLPHTWNAIDGQDGGNDYHRGACWYVNDFTRPELEPGGKSWLEIIGAAMTAEVWLNGKRLGRHEGGYSTFRVELTDPLADKNTLVISVDNGDNDSVYPQRADFTFYGGLYREVRLINVPHAHFSLGHYGAPGIRVTPKVEDTHAEVEVTVWADNA